MEPGLNDQELNEVIESMPDGIAGMFKTWGFQQFAAAVAKKIYLRVPDVYWKDGDTAKLVSRLTYIATKYHSHDCLRELMAGELRPVGEALTQAKVPLTYTPTRPEL